MTANHYNSNYSSYRHLQTWRNFQMFHSAQRMCICEKYGRGASNIGKSSMEVVRAEVSILFGDSCLDSTLYFLGCHGIGVEDL